MDTMIKIVLILSMILGLVYADDAKARKIMEKVDARYDGDTIVQDMIMVLIDKNKKKRVRQIKSYSKDFGVDEHRLLFFKSPSDVKNTAFLTYDYDNSKKDDDQWLYLPALKKTKRIPSSDKSSSFMGSDFSYSDMTDKDLDDYDFKLLKESSVKGEKVWVISTTPRSKEIIDETGYTKGILLIRQDNYMLRRAIYTLKNKAKKKYLDVSKMHEQSGVWVIDEMKMMSKRGKKMTHKTILQFKNIQINTPLEDALFTTRRLEKGL